MFDKFKDSVKDLKDNVKSSVAEKEIQESDIRPIVEDFRLQLLQNNVSLEAAEQIEESVIDNLTGKKAGRFSIDDEVENSVKQVIRDNVSDQFDFIEEIEGTEGLSVFFIGFNGSGKTTTLAKIANLLDEKGYDSVFGAGDTFRAASMEQLEEHGENLGKKVISREYESDPAAVAYDTIEHAEREGKVALIDTAGRSHSDRNLMDELKKMIEVNDPDITFLVVDSLSGNDVVNQLKEYEGMFDAVVLTKMDIDDKGGAAISVSFETDKPVAFKGTGQEYEDLEIFNSEEFVENLLS